VFEVFSTPELEEDKQEEKKEEESGSNDEEDLVEPSRLALGGGGRYDDLIQLLGGKETPAVGAACGIERLIWLMKKESLRFPQERESQVFLAQLGSLAKRKILNLIEDFRREDISILESLGRDSLNAQLKIADKEGIRYTLILGHKEALNDKIMLRDMKTGKQEEIKMDKVVKTIKSKLKN
jgi:histidyl-tRNA synthetase